MLDRMAKDRAISLFNEKFFGRLELKELQLKFPNDITLINPRIYVPGEATPALEARNISLKLNFLTLLQPEIRLLYLRRLTADSLNARIIKQENGKINLDLAFTSRDPDSTKKSLEHFFSKKIQLKNSSISYAEQNKHSSSPTFFLKNINMELSSFTTKKKLLKGKLDKLQFNIPLNSFSLRQASGTFLFSDTRSEILTLKTEGNKSNAELSATFSNFNIFSPQRQKQLYQATSFVNIQKLAIHSDDLKLLFPSHTLPEGTYTLKGNAKGKKDNIEILDALLTHLNSRIALKGKLLNLQNRTTFGFQLECYSSRIASIFLESFLKKSFYKDIAHNTGDITFFGQTIGNLKSAQTDLTIRSAPIVATISAKTTREESEQLTCKGTIALKNVKTQKLIGFGGQKGLFNAFGSFEGKQFKKEINQLTIDMKVVDSFWQNQPLKEGFLRFNYDNSIMTSMVFLKNHLTTFNLNAEIDWKNKVPRYQAVGKLDRLDISKVLGSDGIKTDLNGLFNLKGSGFDPEMLNISSVMQFAPSVINSIQLKDNSKIFIEIAQHEGFSRTNINSDFLDIHTESNCTLEKLITFGKMTSAGISREIASQNIWQTKLSTPENDTGKLVEPFTVNYRITVKNISPLTVFFPIQDFSLRGNVEGLAIYRNGQCSLESSIKLEEFKVRNYLQLENLSMKASIECTGSATQKASVTGHISSITYEGTKTSEAFFTGIYTLSHLDVMVDLAIPDFIQSFSTKFSVIKNSNSYDLTLNHLSMKDAENIWQISEESHILLSRTAAKLNHLTLEKGPQLIVLDGELSNLQASSFQCKISNFQLKELKQFFRNPSFKMLEGTINASLTFSGNPELKTSVLKVIGQNIRYDKIVIGSLQGSANHRGDLLHFDIHSSTPVSEKNTEQSTAINIIEGSGNIPISLTYYPLQIHVNENQAINASFHSDNLSAQFLEYLLPFFESAEGVIPTTLKIEGKTPQPDIYLISHLQDNRIKIEPTQVSYLINGEIYITPKVIELRDINIRDNLMGIGQISGQVKLYKMEPKELTIEGKFDKLLLFNKKDRKDETSFGTITGTTNNILLHGNFSAPLIEGELKVNAADFSIYRIGANESAKYVGINKFIEFVPSYPSNSITDINNKKKSTKPTEFHYSLFDILQVKNLKLNNLEPLKYTVIFDRLRGEQLETSINNLSLMVNKTNQLYRLFGSVNIVGGKYKFTNSNFDLQNGGKITWNNADIRGGVMNNLYGIKYVNTTNQQTGERDNIKLLLAITGTLNEPQVGMGYYLNEQSQPFASVNMIGGQSSQIDPNAELNVISMLLSKQWYIRPGSSNQNNNIASSVGISAGTGMISSQISKVVQDIAGLESFNVNVGVDKHGTLSGLDLYFALNVPGTGGKVRFIGTGNSPSIRESVMSDYYGTAQKIEYRVTPKVYLEAYRSYGQIENETSSINLEKPSETWGASISYRERFHTWEQFWKRIIPSSDKKK